MTNQPAGADDQLRHFSAHARDVRGLVQGDYNTVHVGQDATLSPFPIFLAPPRLEIVFGRDEILNEVRSTLKARLDPAPVLLRGLPGAGKTTIALELAHDPTIAANHPDGVLWVSVGKEGQGVLPGLVDWGRALGVSATDIAGNSIQSWCRALHHATRQKSLLIVVDDVWRVHDALPFLIGGDACSRLVTTRSHSVCAEISTTPPFEIHDLVAEDSKDLLVHTAGLSDSPLAVELNALVEPSGGLPLTLVVAGAYIRRHVRGGDVDRVKTAFTRIRDRRLRLDLARPGSPFEHHDVPMSLARMISLSVDDLGPAAVRALRVLAHLPPRPNTFSKTAAATICGVSEDVIYELADCGLLDVNRTEPRYSFHQSIVDFALELPVVEDAEGLIISYFVAEAERVGGDRVAMHSDIANHLAALDFAFERGEDNDYLRGALALAPAMKDQVPYLDVERYLRRALRLARKGGDEGAEARILFHLADMAHVTEGAWSAEAYARDGLRISQTAERTAEKIDLLLQLGAAQHMRGDLEGAVLTTREAYVLADGINDRGRVAQAAFQIGDITHTAGDEDEAYALSLESYRIAQELEMATLQADVSYVLGWVHFVRGDYAQSLEAFETQDALGRAAGSRRTVASAADGIGWLRFVRGDLTGSLTAYRVGLEQAVELDDIHAAALLSNLGVVEQALGDFEAAERSYAEAIALSERFRQEQSRCKAWLHYGELAYEQNQYDTALDRLGIAAEIASRYSYSDLAMQVSRARVEVYAHSGRVQDAHAELETNAYARGAYTHKFEMVRLARTEAMIANLTGDIAGSREILSRALDTAAVENFRAEEGLCRLALARTEQSAGNRTVVLEQARSGLEILEECGHRAREEARELLDRLV